MKNPATSNIRTHRFVATMMTLVGGLFLFAATANANTFVVTNTNNTGAGSLAQAILDANAHVGADVINFNIPGIGLHKISPAAGLPKITDQVKIDGYSQPGASPNMNFEISTATLVIELNGSNAGVNGTGLDVRAPDCEITGLVINHFKGIGIAISPEGSAVITGCFIGTDDLGKNAAPNGVGVFINGSSHSKVGDKAFSARNVISGNLEDGVRLSNFSTLDFVTGNLIGTDREGEQAIPNGIGVNCLDVSGPQTIGAVVQITGNIISGNKGAGISLTNSDYVLIKSNSIGLDVLGGGIIGNRDGIELDSANNNQIGDHNEPNVLSRNKLNGILFKGTSSFNLVEGNRIGTEAGGIAAFGNGLSGINITGAAHNNDIGSFTPSDANIIAFNPVGIAVSGSTGNFIQHNSIFSNTNLGIDLIGAIGPDSNDQDDSDTGPNNMQNYPVITSVTTSGGTTTIAGTLNAEANNQYGLQFFSNTQCDPSGFGEGKTHLGDFYVYATSNNSAFLAHVPAVKIGEFVTATATSSSLGSIGPNTSEFSKCKQVTASQALPVIIIQNASADEGGPGSNNQITFPVLLSAPSAQNVTVNFVTANGTATAPEDYVTTSGTLTIPAGKTTGEIKVPLVGDDRFELLIENFAVELSNPVGALLGNSPATGTISDDDPSPTISIGATAQKEGDSGVTPFMVQVALSNPSYQPITVNYASAGGSATSGADFEPINGTLSFIPGEKSKALTVKVVGDTTVESDEAFFVNLANASNAKISNAQGTLTILNDDVPSLSISDVTKAEGNSAATNFTFNVTLSDPGTSPVSVDYQTMDGGATAGSDYQSASGKLNFAVGETSKTVSVLVNGDAQDEPDETFLVQLSNQTNATLGKAQGTGTITNDDAPQKPGDLQFSSASFSVNENGGQATITVKRTGGSKDAVSVQYTTNAGGTATAGSDYTAASGTLNWADGDASDKTFTIAIADDVLNEGNETVNLSLSNPTGKAALGNPATVVLTIADNDSQPSLSIADLSLVEGNSGTTSFDFAVTLSAASGQTVTVDYLTADGTALVGGDYQSGGGTLTFAPGETSKSISVFVKGDLQNEDDETFVVNLSNPFNAAASKSQGKGTIVNDDNAPSLQAVQFSQASYNVQEDLGALTITVTRSGDASAAASVDYTTVDNQAVQKNDYEFAAGTLNFAPGETSKTITLLINEDAHVEGSETFKVSLSNPAGASIGATSTASVVIVDDAPESPTSPIDDTQSFVYMHYHDFLNREPDLAGLQFWVNEIESCGVDAKCREVKRINVSAAFFLSIEFQETGYLRYLMEKESFGSTPKYTDFMRDVQEVSNGVIVNSPGWEQKLKENQKQFADKWVNRPVFKAMYDSMSNTDFVNSIYTNAGILPSQARRDSLVSVLETNSESRSAVLLEVAGDAGFRQKEYSAAFVMMQYFGYLRRDPAAAPDADLSGYNFWLNKLNQFGGNYIDAEMIKAFIISFEYRGRFAQ